jgi:hypothetical protein
MDARRADDGGGLPTTRFVVVVIVIVVVNAVVIGVLLALRTIRASFSCCFLGPISALALASFRVCLTIVLWVLRVRPVLGFHTSP